MRNLTEPLWNFSSAPCGRCLTRSLKLPRPAARVTPELWFFRDCHHCSTVLRPTRQFRLALFPVHASRGRSAGREAFHDTTQNRSATRPFVIGSGASYCRKPLRSGLPKRCNLLPERGKERTITAWLKKPTSG